MYVGIPIYFMKMVEFFSHRFQINIQCGRKIKLGYFNFGMSKERDDSLEHALVIN